MKRNLTLLILTILCFNACGSLREYASSSRYLDGIYNKPTTSTAIFSEEDFKYLASRQRELAKADSLRLKSPYSTSDTKNVIIIGGLVGFSGPWFNTWYNPWYGPWYDPWYYPWHHPWYDPWYRPYGPWPGPWPVYPGSYVWINPRVNVGSRTQTMGGSWYGGGGAGTHYGTGGRGGAAQYLGGSGDNGNSYWRGSGNSSRGNSGRVDTGRSYQDRNNSYFNSSRSSNNGGYSGGGYSGGGYSGGGFSGGGGGGGGGYSGGGGRGSGGSR